MKMKNKCEEVGLPAPAFKYKASDFWVEFRKDIYNESYLKTLSLNDRQIKAVIYTKENEKITNKEYQNICGCSRNTASTDLAELVQKNILITSGQKGAGAYYTLK